MFKGCFWKYQFCATCLHWLSVSNYEDVQHVDIRVLSEDVGFSVMLEMPMVPPVGGGSLREQRFNICVTFPEKKYTTENYLQMTDDKLVQHVIPPGLLEDRQVAKVVLQPSSLRLKQRKK